MSVQWHTCQVSSCNRNCHRNRNDLFAAKKMAGNISLARSARGPCQAKVSGMHTNAKVYHLISVFVAFDILCVTMPAAGKSLFSCAPAGHPQGSRCFFEARGWPSMNLRGGGRMTSSEKNARRKQAQEQMQAGIGKSMWRRDRENCLTEKQKRNNKVMEEIRKRASELSTKVSSRHGP
jgi:hypothetical protein